MPNHLIIVCCHGIWLGGKSNGTDEAEWLISDFQAGETSTFIEHIKAGVRCLAEDRDNAALVFSGGPTRKETRLSEAQSYVNIAVANNFFHLLQGPTPSHEDVVLVEERALDSYHNILFSLTLFYARFRNWPSHLTIVSHAFKKPRLIEGHCAAIGFPLEKVSFVGIDPPGMGNGENAMAMKGVEQAVDEWMADPHGRGERLARKRAKRNPWGTWQGVFEEVVAHQDQKGGLLTREESGEQEILAEEAPRPWV